MGLRRGGLCFPDLGAGVGGRRPDTGFAPFRTLQPIQDEDDTSRCACCFQVLGSPWGRIRFVFRQQSPARAWVFKLAQLL